MIRRRAGVMALVCCCVLLGVKTIQSAAPAVAASTATSRTAPRDLTNQFPLGPERLCCQSQSASHSQTSAAPPSNGATPPARAGASASSGSTPHASSDGTFAAFWIILAAVAAALLAVGIASSRRRRRRYTPALPPGVPVAGHVASARPPPAARAPGVASGTDSVRPRNETATRAFRAPVIPMDSAIAPMAAEAFWRMAYDADNATDPENEARAEDESEDPGDTE